MKSKNAPISHARCWWKHDRGCIGMDSVVLVLLACITSRPACSWKMGIPSSAKKKRTDL
jgi:hypothetical protein